jgi:hypothetical protein
MGEAKRRGTFDQRRERAIDKQVALIAARPAAQDRPMVIMENRNMQRAREMWALMDAVTRSQGIFIYRRAD